jgi:competence ComEA-like helix-hairpin-helix protein
MTHSNRPVAGTYFVSTLVAAGLLAVVAARLARPIRIDFSNGAEAITRSGASWPDARVDLNSAGAAELTLLPGIGPRLAERIVADRTSRGRFESVDDLTRVNRIGQATVRRLRPFAVIASEF